MLINNDQPLEVFLACCTLVNTGAWASIVPMEGPGSTSPFPVNEHGSLGFDRADGRTWVHITFFGK